MASVYINSYTRIYTNHVIVWMSMQYSAYLFSNVGGKCFTLGLEKTH